MHRTVRRSLVVALATVVASLTIMASPAAAVVHPVTLTGGTVTSINQPGNAQIPVVFAGPVGAGCSSNSAVDVLPGVPNTIDITVFTSLEHFVLNNIHYVIRVTRLSSIPGTWSNGTINSATLTIDTQIWMAANQSSTNFDCVPVGPVLCTLRDTLHLAGTYTGTPSIPSATFDLSTTAPAHITPAPGVPCQPPFTSFISGRVVVDHMTGHF